MMKTHIFKLGKQLPVEIFLNGFHTLENSIGTSEVASLATDPTDILTIDYKMHTGP